MTPGFWKGKIKILFPFVFLRPSLSYFYDGIKLNTVSMYHVQDFDIHIATFKAITVFPRIISRSNNPPPPKRCPPHRPCMHIWNIKQAPLVNKLSLPPGLEILWTSNDGDDWMGANIKTQRNPSGFLQNPPKNPKQKLTPQKSHTEFLSLKNLQKALNDITWKIWTIEIECLQGMQCHDAQKNRKIGKIGNSVLRNGEK